MPGYFPLSIPPSPPSINIISEISFTIISLSSTDKLLIITRGTSGRSVCQQFIKRYYDSILY